MKWCRQHSFCIIVMLIVVLISVIVVLRGNDKDLVSHVSLACAIAGGLLAVIVIVYTLIDSADVRTNLTEMRMLMAEVRGDVGKTASAVDRLREAQNILSTDLTSRVVPKETVQTKQDQETESLPFRLSELSTFAILFFYCVVKSFREKRSFVLFDLIQKMFPEEKEEGLLGYAFCASGVLIAFAGLVGHEQIDISIYQQPKIKHIPPEICDAVEKVYNQLSKNVAPEEEKKMYAWKQAVDDSFTGLRETDV